MIGIKQGVIAIGRDVGDGIDGEKVGGLLAFDQKSANVFRSLGRRLRRDAGLVAIAGRRGFERLYDLTERVIPRAVLDAPVPSREESLKQLSCLGAKAQGVGTARDLARHFEIDGWRERFPAGPLWTREKKARRTDQADRQTADRGAGG